MLGSSPKSGAIFDRRLDWIVDFVGKKDGRDNSPMLVMAVALRLMALDAIVVDPELRGWLMLERSQLGSPTFTAAR